MKTSSRIGYIVGLVFTIGFFFLLPMSVIERQVAVGPMNTGHEDISCKSCHVLAKGSIRQQIQANARYLFGMGKNGVDFGKKPVNNSICQDCHGRPNDAHPVSRFLEPRFAEARQAIHPENCVSCHVEHKGVRVTVEPTYCSLCHSNVLLKDDPITYPHDELAADGEWETCLRCHDFHANHVMKVETVVAKGIKQHKIDAYFKGSPTPYSDKKRYKAKKEVNRE